MARKKKQPPETITMTELEQAKLENIRLKLSMAQAEVSRLQAEQNALGGMLVKKYGLDDLSKYIFNPHTGVGKRVGTASKEQQK